MDKPNIAELAVAAWRLERWLENLNAERKLAAKKSLREIKTYLEASGIEIVDPLGWKFDEGLPLQIVNNEADDEDDVIAITPSGISYTGMKPEDIAIVDLDGNWLDGNYKPSSEVPMHTAVMRARPDVKATVHTHAMFATIMAMGDNPELRPITPPQCEFTPVGIVPFTMQGSNDVAKKSSRSIGRQWTCRIDQKPWNVLLW